MNNSKFNIECAKKFVQKMDEGQKERKERTLSKYWETNKKAASYIFAFYELCISALEQSSSIDQFVDALARLAEDQKCLNKLLGHAAYSADTLAKQARNVRKRDFKGVQRVEPHLADFTADELQIISVIDAERPMSNKDREQERPPLSHESGQ